jgi:hypothetical protein
MVSTVMSSFWPKASAARAMLSADWALMAAVRSKPGDNGDSNLAQQTVDCKGIDIPSPLSAQRSWRRYVWAGNSTSAHPRVKTNGNGPGSAVRYMPSKKTNPRLPVSFAN